MSLGVIGWGRFVVRNPDGTYSRNTVPPGLYRLIHQNAIDLGRVFDVFQWPPISKVQGGNGDGCDGYEVFDPYDLGTKPQQGSIETHYGTFEEFMMATAALRSNGCVSAGDLSMHQRGGENGGPGVFLTLGADHITKNGLGNAVPGYFRGGMNNNDPIPPFRPADPVPVPADDFPFGREVVYKNCLPSGATVAAATAYIQWLVKRTNFVRFRWDDTKGTNAEAVAAIMNAVPDLPFYSEYFDGNAQNLNWWATTWPMNSRSAVEDFTLHWRIQAACNGFDATQFFAGGYGYCQMNSGLSVTFVDNPDTDTSPGQQVVFNKGHAYAFMLNLPCQMALVYGKDYYGGDVWPGAYGLKPIIDNLCWVSRMFAYGNFERRYVDRDVWAYTRDGDGGAIGWSGGLLMAGNFNTDVERTITVQTTWAPGTWAHDYSLIGGSPYRDFTVGANGMLTVTLNANSFSRGVSFVALAPGGVNRPYIMRTLPTTHTWVGDGVSDTLQLANGALPLPQRIYARQGTVITTTLTLDRSNLAPTANAQVQILSPTLATLGTEQTGPSNTVKVRAVVEDTGFHTLQLIGTSFNQPATFELSASYTGA